MIPRGSAQVSALYPWPNVASAFREVTRKVLGQTPAAVHA